MNINYPPALIKFSKNLSEKLVIKFHWPNGTVSVAYKTLEAFSERSNAVLLHLVLE